MSSPDLWHLEMKSFRLLCLQIQREGWVGGLGAGLALFSDLTLLLRPALCWALTCNFPANARHRGYFPHITDEKLVLQTG